MRNDIFSAENLKEVLKNYIAYQDFYLNLVNPAYGLLRLRFDKSLNAFFIQGTETLSEYLSFTKSKEFLLCALSLEENKSKVKDDIYLNTEDKKIFNECYILLNTH